MPPLSPQTKTEQLDWIKGVAIILIALGHNHYFNLITHDIFPFLYNFHVWIFFFVPLLRSVAVPSVIRARDLATRYMTPQIITLSLLSILYFATIAHKNASLGEHGATFLSALAFETAQLTNKATGFQLYWFLPAFLTYSLILSSAKNLSSRQKILFYVPLFIAHGFIGLIPSSIAAYIPFSLAPVAYLLPLAFLVSLILPAAKKHIGLTTLVAAIVFAVGSYLSLALGTTINLGDLFLYSYETASYMLLHDLIAISGFLLIVTLSQVSFLNIKILRFAGQNSLYIFLVHQVVFQTIWQAAPATHAAGQFPMLYLLYGLTSLCISLAAGMFLGAALNHFPRVKNIVFPATYEGWKNSLALRRVRAQPSAGEL
jgi:fucose 4-O-acetylase-like acetyltransferase